jgi:nitroreductase
MGNDLFAVMAGRRSVKHFAPRPVEMDKVLQVISAGHLAPSSGNLQNWSFTIITDTAQIRELYHHTLDQEAFLSAMIAIIVCGDADHAHKMYGMRGKRLYTIQNCAAAIQNMLLAAHALGLGAVWVGAFDEDKVAAMFGIPNEAHRPQAIILLGYPDEELPPKDSKPLADVVYFNTFGNKVMRPHLIFYDWATEWRNQAQKLRNHLADLRHASTGKNENLERIKEKERAEAPENPLTKAREHIRQAVDKLKREQYQNKK